MELTVIGNINFCLDIQEPKLLSYKISGLWTFDRNDSDLLVCQENLCFKISGYNIVRLMSKIKGCDYEDVSKILKSFNIDFILTGETTIQEFDLIKSLFSLFYWLDFQLVDNRNILVVADPVFEKNTEIPSIFDDFIIDYPDKIFEGKLKDMYLIKKEYESKFTDEKRELIGINLLSEFKVMVNSRTVTNYFVPFTKPAYKKELYRTQGVLDFYKKLLDDRDSCLRKHFNR